MLRRTLSLAAALSLSLAVHAAPAAEDVVFKALGDELKRSMALHLEDLDTPYFIQYEVSDSTTYRVSAAYGGLLGSDENHARILVSQVRVGSYTLDNSNFAGGRGGGRSGVGASAALPLDDDYEAIRHAIWWATDWQYKDALEVLSRKRAYLKERNSEERPPDFTETNGVTLVEDQARLAFDRPHWEQYVRKISASSRDFPRLQSANVGLVAGLENRYQLNSEGLRLRRGQTETLLRITLEAQADDGQRLSDHLTYYAPTPEQLPSAAEVLADARKLAERLTRAVTAPVLEEYSGPVLFDGLAATQLFRQLLASGITSQPEPLGAPRRSAQASDDLDSRVGKRILPQTFQIYDDPRLPKYEETFLAGHYSIDDEGIPAQRVNIVVDGKLEGMVTSRTPTKRFTQSNGHGRRGGSETPRSAIGCLFIESSKGLGPDELKKQLLDAADGEGLKFGLRVTGLQSRSGASAGGRSRRGGGGAGRVVGDPIGISKVFVADGHEEPVRGCEFAAIDLQSLKKILAAGTVRTVQNSVIGSTPSSSIIAPAVLIGELELSLVKPEGEKKPILPAPQARTVPAIEGK